MRYKSEPTKKQNKQYKNSQTQTIVSDGKWGSGEVDKAKTSQRYGDKEI